MNSEQIKTAQLIALGVLEAIQDAGDLGAPAGVLYAALMAQGCTLSQFQSLMAPLEGRRFVAKASDCYTITPAGETFIGQLRSKLGIETPCPVGAPPAFAQQG